MEVVFGHASVSLHGRKEMSPTHRPKAAAGDPSFSPVVARSPDRATGLVVLLRSLEFGVEGNLGIEHPGNGAIGLGVGGDLRELLTRDPGNARGRVEMNAGNRPVTLDLFQRQRRLRR